MSHSWKMPGVLFLSGKGSDVSTIWSWKSIILIYITVQLGLYILPYKPAHAPGFSGQHPPESDCHPADAFDTFFPKLQQTLATECKNKEKEKEKNPF